MPLVIDNPVAEERLHAFAAARGLRPDEAIIAAIMSAEDAQDLPLTPEELESARRGMAQADAGDLLTIEECLEQGRAELERLFAEKQAKEKAA